MKNPFRVLDLPDQCDDKEVKRAYLHMVKRYPPEQHPERFREIRAAFEAIQTERERVSFQLFRVPDADTDRLFDSLFSSLTPGMPTQSDILNVIDDDIKRYHLPTK